MAERTVRAACPHDCPDTCAMLVRVDSTGRAVALEGDPAHPITRGFLCGKVRPYLERVYAPDRLLTPQLRTGPKGSGRYREVSWDEALDVAATGLRDTIDRHGPQAVLPYSYLGTQGVLQGGSMANRFFAALGASQLVRTICASAGNAGTRVAHGMIGEVDPEEWVHARTLVIWGWNPMSTAPHLWALLSEARRRGARMWVVDPFRSRTARVADEHVRPVPGTDAALGLALMRSLLDEGLADEEWCRSHGEGYDDLVARLGERTVEEWAAPTGVPVETVRTLARALAVDQPSLLRMGVGGQRHLGAPIAYRTLACIPALTGSWRHRGGGFSYIPLAAANALDTSAIDGAAQQDGPVRSLNMSQLGDALTDSTLEPPVSALVVWSSNPAAIAPDQDAVLRGLARDDLFTVVLEHFMTDTARHADVVLPVTMQLEHADLHWSWGHHYITLNEPAIEPLGETRTTTEVFRLLAARLGLDDPCFAESDADMLAQVGLPNGVSWDALRETGWAKTDLGRGSVPHADGGFDTPSGRVQLRADALVERGIDPLPHYEPPAEVADEALAARYPLCLITPKTHLFLNSTFSNGRRQKAAQPEPELVLHPDDALSRGIATGDMVRIANDRGAFRARARVSDDAREGTAVAPMGWWNADWPDNRSCQMTTPQRLTDLGQAPTFNDNRVEVELDADAAAAF